MLSLKRTLLFLLAAAVGVVAVVYVRSGRESTLEGKLREAEALIAEGAHANALDVLREAQALDGQDAGIDRRIYILEEHLKDLEEARELATIADSLAAQSPHEALNLLALVGQLNPAADLSRALERTQQRAAEKPNTRSPAYARAVALFEADLFGLAFPTLLLEAQGGHIWSQAHVAWMYETGQGVAPDPRAAYLWYKRAARQGDAMAQVHVGNSYAAGRGTPQDDREALRWFRRAAEQGQPRGLNHVGEFLRDGRGGPKNEREAARMFEQAADMGYPLAQGNLGDFYRDGRGGFEPDTTRAAALYRQAILNANRLSMLAPEQVYVNRLQALRGTHR